MFCWLLADQIIIRYGTGTPQARQQLIFRMWSPRPKMIVDSLWSTGNILPATFVDFLWSTGNILPATFVDSLLSTGNILPATLLYLSGCGKTIPGDEQFRERTHHAGEAVGRVPGMDQISIKTPNLEIWAFLKN